MPCIFFGSHSATLTKVDLEQWITLHKSDN